MDYGKFMKRIQWIAHGIAMGYPWPENSLSFALGPRGIDPLFDDVAQEVPSDQSGHEKLHLHVGVKPGSHKGRSHKWWGSPKNGEWGLFVGLLSDCHFFWILIIYNHLYIILYCIIFQILWILVKHWSDLVESSRTFPSTKPGDEQWSNGSLMEV